MPGQRKGHTLIRYINFGLLRPSMADMLHSCFKHMHRLTLYHDSSIFFLYFYIFLLPPLLSVRADPYVRHYIHYLLASRDLSAPLYSISALASAPKHEVRLPSLHETSKGEAGG